MKVENNFTTPQPLPFTLPNKNNASNTNNNINNTNDENELYNLALLAGCQMEYSTFK
jgi:hypothetical protein